MAAPGEDAHAGGAGVGEGACEGGVDVVGGADAVDVAALGNEEDGGVSAVLASQSGEFVEVAGSTGGRRVGEEADTFVREADALDLEGEPLAVLVPEEEVESGGAVGPFGAHQRPSPELLKGALLQGFADEAVGERGVEGDETVPCRRFGKAHGPAGPARG